MKERKVRLFISSTFRDMNAERDYLNNYVFPQIKQYCDDRYIEFTPIDLRWGVTEEERRNGLVIASCMEEVDNARPFFIGILGERYGWMPDIDDLNCERPVITQNQEWLLSMLTKSASMTEIEMDYAALKDHNVEHALFFIKADDVELPADFCEKPDSVSYRKLKQLKDKIRQQKRYPVHSYHTSKEVGDIILKELKKMIDTEFPPSKDDYMTSIINRHEYSLQQHAFSLFDTTSNIKTDLEEWTKRKKWVFFITGKSGIGTSNRLAHMVLDLRRQWSAYEKTDHKRIIYYDFEYASPGISYFDDFQNFLTLVQDPIRMIAIDNASLLDVHDAERLWGWVRDTQTMAIIAATYSPFSHMMQCSINSVNLTIHGMSTEQSRSLIVNYPKMYGKQLTDKQIDKIMQCKQVSDPTMLTFLLAALVRFGSIEQLDDRIEKLVHEADWDIFAHLVYEYEKIFNEEKLADCFNKALVTIAMHGNLGISENDLIDSLQLSLAEWAIVRPIVLQFCHNNTQRLSFIRSNWAQDIKNIFATPWTAKNGCQVADWWWGQEKRDNEKYSAILSIHSYIWHLPYEHIKQDFERFIDRVKSIILSPKTVIMLPINELAPYFPHFGLSCNFHVYDKIPFLIGKPVDQLSPQEQEHYYSKLAKIALSTVFQNFKKDKIYVLNNEAAFCYRQIANLQTDPHKALIYNAKALLAEYKADKAIKLVSTFWGGVKGNPKEQIDKRLIRLEGYLQKNYMDKYLPEGDELSKIVYDNPFDEVIEPMCTLISQTCYQMVMYGVKSAREYAISLINELAKHFMDYFDFTSPFLYYVHITYSIIYLKGKKWEELYQQARSAYLHAYYIYGDDSYQAGRANILYNYAYSQLNGKFADTNGDYYKNFVPRPYRQVIDAELSDRRTRISVDEENAFYANLIHEINSIIKY